MTAKQINAYLKRQKSPLAGYGNSFVRASKQYRIPVGWLVAISGAESSFGKIQSGKNNAWGWGPGIDFPDYNTAINTIAKGLRTNYVDKGLSSVPAIASKYVGASDPTGRENWVNNVKQFLGELGGGGVPGGAVSPSQPTGVPEPSSTPDLSGFALQGLGQIGKGYDALQGLSDLTNAVKAGESAPGTAPSGPSVSGSSPAITPVKGNLTYNGQKLTHNTDGLDGYPAVDIFGKPGTAFNAPEAGKVVRWSGKGGTSGNVFGYSVYFEGVSGKKYFFTHLGPGRAKVGRTLKKGQRIGRISPWTGGDPHVHAGVHG